jgi:hypothetical protein
MRRALATVSGLAFAFLAACDVPPGEDANIPAVASDQIAAAPGEKRAFYLWEGRYHPITYVQRGDDLITGGDIVLDPARLYQPSAGALESPPAALTVKNNAHWPSRNISYFIDTGFNSTDLATITGALSSMDSQTNLVFTRLSARPTGTSYTTYILIQHGTQASSGVGYPGDHLFQTITLPDGIGAPSTQHETGHALGMFHEHQRPDRDLYLQMFPDQYCQSTVGPSIDLRATVGCGSGSWNTDFGLQSMATGAGPFDFESMMMYGAGSWALNDTPGHLLVQPDPNKRPDYHYIGPVPAQPVPAPGLSYVTMIRRGFAFPSDVRSFQFGHPPNMSAQDVSSINSLFPSNAIQIGWIDRGGSCPGGRGTIFMDDENTVNATSAHVKTGFFTSFPSNSNYTGTTGVWKTSTGTQINFCRQTIAALPTLRDDYAVLKLSNDCPLNSFQFARTSDDENTGNTNTNSGSIAPSTQTKTGAMTGSTTLQFCFVPGDGAVNSAAQPVPPWKTQTDPVTGATTTLNQAAFTRGNFDNTTGCNVYHWHVKDDEDTNNAFAGGVDPYSYAPAAAPFAARIRTLFVDSVTETHMTWAECK